MQSEEQKESVKVRLLVKCFSEASFFNKTLVKNLVKVYICIVKNLKKV